MIVRSIKLCNFKNFRDEQTICLQPSSKNKNIILIGGINGAGKTTLLEALRLCMFGKRANGYALSSKEYSEYIRASKNRASKKENDQRYYVEVCIELNDSFPIYDITLRREWNLAGKGFEENIHIFRDGNPFELVPNEYWEDYISTIFPPHLAEYFFFDGEKLKEITASKTALILIKKSIQDVLGLNMLEVLARDLDALIRAIKRRNIKEEQIMEELSSKERELEVLESDECNILAEIEHKEKRLNEIMAERTGEEKHLRKIAGSFARNKHIYESKLQALSSEKGRVEEDISRICGELLPFIIMEMECIDLVAQFDKEMKIWESMVGSNSLERVRKKLINRIKKESDTLRINDEVFKLIRAEIDRTFLDAMHKEAAKGELLHELSMEERAKITEFLSNLRGMEAKINLRALLVEQENILKNIKRVRRKLTEVPKTEYVNEQVSLVAKISVDEEIIRKEIEDLYAAREDHDNKIDICVMEIRSLMENIFCLEEDEKKIEISERAIRVIDEYKDFVIHEKVRELEEQITSMYRELANKDDMVERIEVDRESFEIILLDRHNEIVDKEGISEGEKEILILAVMWGLLKISPKRYPLIMDIPLAKLDSSHVHNILTKYFPRAGEQVILLSHDREIVGEDYGKLQPSIGRMYTLGLGETDKVKEGHFFGSGNVN